jgi:aspartyl/asparaginyl-tRNA synthetase
MEEGLRADVYGFLVSKFIGFCERQGFVFVNAQSKRSILAACEDPRTVVSYELDGEKWPMKQTNQMELEKLLMLNPDWRGVFCLTTSTRDEPRETFIKGRHQRQFDMFEFEGRVERWNDGMNSLARFNNGVFGAFGFSGARMIDYETACGEFSTDELSANHELELAKRYGNFLLLNDFPERTSPFFNMKRYDESSGKVGLVQKTDVELCGVECGGTAVRECDVDIMRDRFGKISEGEYAGLLYELFGKERVNAELDEFLALPMIPRYGGGIGVYRTAKAMEQLGLMPDYLTPVGEKQGVEVMAVS